MDTFTGRGLVFNVCILYLFARQQMSSCDFAAFAGGPCGATNPANPQCVPLYECSKDVKSHMKLLHIPGVRDAAPSEADLILILIKKYR